MGQFIQKTPTNNRFTIVYTKESCTIFEICSFIVLNLTTRFGKEIINNKKI